MSDFDFDRDFDEGRGRRGRFQRFTRGKAKTEPDQPVDYKNIEFLSRHISAQGKITSRKRTGFSGQNQRKVAIAIKRARFLGLLPYVGKS